MLAKRFAHLLWFTKLLHFKLSQLLQLRVTTVVHSTHCMSHIILLCKIYKNYSKIMLETYYLEIYNFFKFIVAPGTVTSTSVITDYCVCTMHTSSGSWLWQLEALQLASVKSAKRSVTEYMCWGRIDSWDKIYCFSFSSFYILYYSRTSPMPTRTCSRRANRRVRFPPTAFIRYREIYKWKIMPCVSVVCCIMVKNDEICRTERRYDYVSDESIEKLVKI